MKVGKTFIQANRPEILFGASITATVASVVLAAKGGYDARGKVADEEMERIMLKLPPEAVVPLEQAVNDDANRLTTKEKARLTWLCYMPAAVTTVGALGSTTGLHLVHVKEKKMLAQAALAAIEEVKTSAKEFEKETLGILTDEEKSKILEKREAEDGTATIQNSDGEIEELYLVRDAKTGRDIWSNKARIEEALLELNNVMNGSGNCDLNYFYHQAGFGHIPDGFETGWSGELVTLEWKETVRDDGRPVRVFSFRNSPQKGYDDAHQ
jgi:hypothetical protein